MCEMKAQHTPEQGTTEKSLRQLRCRRLVTDVVAHIGQFSTVAHQPHVLEVIYGLGDHLRSRRVQNEGKHVFHAHVRTVKSLAPKIYTAQSFLLLVKKCFIDRVVSAFDDGNDIDTRFDLKFHKRTFEVHPEKDQWIRM
ncbi:hypothetical protein MRX96_051929 [Rhipicephalus microplus]